MQESVPAPSREELSSTLKAAAQPSGNVLWAEGKRCGLSKEVASHAQMGTSNLVQSLWIQCCVSRHSAFYPAALEKGDPSVDYNDGDGEDESSFDKQEGGEKFQGRRSHGLESFPRGLNSTEKEPEEATGVAEEGGSLFSRPVGIPLHPGGQFEG